MVQEDIKCCLDDIKWFGVRRHSWPGRLEVAQERHTQLWVELERLQQQERAQ